MDILRATPSHPGWEVVWLRLEQITLCVLSSISKCGNILYHNAELCFIGVCVCFVFGTGEGIFMHIGNAL